MKDGFNTDTENSIGNGRKEDSSQIVQFPGSNQKYDFQYKDNAGKMQHPAFRVQDIDINIKKGSLTMIIGKIGSGKSS